MGGNSFGQAFRITTAGESHGPGNVVIIDGCPPGIPLSPQDFAVDMARRRPGQSKLVTQRSEAAATSSGRENTKGAHSSTACRK